MSRPATRSTLTDRLKKWRPKTKLQREAEHEAERQALGDKYGEAAYADLAPKIIALSVEGGPGLYSRRKHTPCWMYGGELSADHYGVVDGVRSPGDPCPSQLPITRRAGQSRLAASCTTCATLRHA